jgi:hemoglobin
MARHATITDASIASQIETLYGRARTDELLGPVFAAITDWPPHIARITAFWTRTLLGTGRYYGNPLAEHRKHPLTPEMFERWLQLWGETADSLFEPEPAQVLKDRAARIGESLSLGLFFRPA